MMSLHDSLKEICDGLRSARQTERKKCADALKSFLMRNAVPALLTENSLKKSGYQWDNIFDDINDYVIKVRNAFSFKQLHIIYISVNPLYLVHCIFIF